MALLARRAIQTLIDDFSGPPEGLRGLVNRLNGEPREAIAAEWELIIISALDRVGLIAYEPTFGGASNAGFPFPRSHRIARGGGDHVYFR